MLRIGSCICWPAHDARCILKQDPLTNITLLAGKDFDFWANDNEWL